MAIVRTENSTNVRVNSLLDGFLRPPAVDRPTRERALLDVADEAAALPGGVRAWAWGRGPTTLVVHGWGGRGAQFAALVAALVERGRRVVAFDAPAHGDSPGAHATLDDFACGVAAVAAWAGPLEAIVAHSFGAAAVTIALGRGVAAGRVAFVAPFFQLVVSLQRFAVHARLDADANAAFLAALTDANHGHGVDALDGPRLAPAQRAPLLVVHDRDDREVSHRDGAIAAATWPGARLVTTVGLGHTRILDDVHVVGLVRDFVSGAAAPASFVLDEGWRLERELADRTLRPHPGAVVGRGA
ncbi:MAG: alpha/beta fold hydrolase [Myxococcales bacterium]|nr:alpha/beta fold hydrolase [Myxococcales bacterium]MBK7191734.1 alpha/beta fold hydrolase [Myxococcales bacterium]MBP6842683.1 alpha/beta fold hydrolase [Kofleriaceae bacterium]